MIELYISQNKVVGSAAYGKYYPRVSYKQTMNIHDMAVHMAEHNTPFSEGTIEGILRDFVKCVREQTLNGNTVKVDNLAIFKVLPFNVCSRTHFTKSRRIPSMVPSENGVLCSAMCTAISWMPMVCL